MTCSAVEERAARKCRYHSLDHWRGIACLCVIVFHSTIYAVRDNHVSWARPASILISLCQRLWIGVPMFFVISGFCIAATADSTRRSGDFGSFFRRRFRRIFPPYWVFFGIALIGVGIGEWLVPNLFHDNLMAITPPWRFSFWHWLGNLTLSEAWRPHLFGAAHPHVAPFFLGHAWTLAYEEQFYIVTGLLLLISTKRFFLLTGILSVLSIIADRGAYACGIDVSGFFFAQGRWLQFVVGIAVYYAVRHATRRQAIGLVCVLGAMLLYCVRSPRLLLEPNGGTRLYLLVSAGFSLLILALYRFDLRIASIPMLNGLRICGTMCYSLYLVHWPICKAITHLMYLHNVRGNVATLTVTVPICICASLAAGWAFHVLIERRFLNSPAPAALKEPVAQAPTALIEEIDLEQLDALPA